MNTVIIVPFPFHEYSEHKQHDGYRSIGDISTMTASQIWLIPYCLTFMKLSPELYKVKVGNARNTSLRNGIGYIRRHACAGLCTASPPTPGSTRFSVFTESPFFWSRPSESVSINIAVSISTSPIIMNHGTVAIALVQRQVMVIQGMWSRVILVAIWSLMYA